MAEKGGAKSLAAEPRKQDNAAQPLVAAENVEKTFHQAGESLTVLKGLNLSIQKGEMVALVGPSGSGKSTLLQIVGMLDTPSAGRVTVAGRDVSRLGDDERTRLRRDYVGFVYQFHYLQAEFTALENVMMPQLIAGRSKKQAREHAIKLLTALRLGHRLDHRPARLSGGEQQRVAIARALANRPRLLLADEPTGNLDPETAAEVFKILLDLVRSTGIGALIATHNMDLADQMDRVLEMRGGRVLPY